MGLVRLVFLLFLCACGASRAGQALDLTLRDMKISNRQYMHFGPGDESVSIAEVYCARVMRTFWSNSRHPGYLRTPNQRQNGPGFKCELGTENPYFVSLAMMTNSQYGATIAISFGKQFDLLWLNGPFGSSLHFYVGLSLTALSYEMPAKNRTLYGIVPIANRGVRLDLPCKGCSFGWEEEILPKDNVRLRGWTHQLKLRKEMNIL